MTKELIDNIRSTINELHIRSLEHMKPHGTGNIDEGLKLRALALLLQAEIERIS